VVGLLAGPADAVVTRTTGPLPADAFRADVTLTPVVPRVTLGHLWAAPTARLVNRSPHTWPAEPRPDGRDRVALLCRWIEETRGEYLRIDAPFDADVRPGAAIDVPLPVRLPTWEGRYTLEVSLAQNGEPRTEPARTTVEVLTP
jgi:hypothetical protein